MPDPIRVLHVFAQMNRGGAETMIMNLYRHVNRSKVQFDFIVHTEDKCSFDDEIQSLGGIIYRFPRYIGKNHFRYKQIWKKFFRNHTEYKIIHGHVRSTASIYLNIAKKNGLITIAHSHSTSSGIGFSAIAKNILQYPIRYTADYFFACSKLAGEWLFGKKVCKSDIFFILNNAIETRKFIFSEKTRTNKRKELGIEDRYVVGHIGRFNYPKNHEFLISIFREIYNRYNNAVLLLVGDGELCRSIRKKVNDLGISNNVIFTGVRVDIPELLQAMDVFVFPSLYEGLPVTLVEAQASGLKTIVSSNITPEIKLTDLIEFVSLEKDPEFWAERVLEYKNEYKRENTYNKICNKRYDIEDNAKWLERFYIQHFI